MSKISLYLIMAPQVPSVPTVPSVPSVPLVPLIPSVPSVLSVLSAVSPSIGICHPLHNRPRVPGLFSVSKSPFHKSFTVFSVTVHQNTGKVRIWSLILNNRQLLCFYKKFKITKERSTKKELEDH